MTDIPMSVRALEPSLAPTQEVVDVAPLSMEKQLEGIHKWCAQLSQSHRLSFPADLVRDRIHQLSSKAGSLFQDRVVEICFLLDQHGTLRFNELLRSLGTISTRTLADKLALMQQEAIVMRTVFSEMPVRVEYSLTARGKTLTDLLFPALIHVAQPSEPVAEA